MAMMIVVMMISAIVVMVIVFSNDDCGNGNCDISKLFSRSRDVELLFSPEGSEGAVQVMEKVETAFR